MHFLMAGESAKKKRERELLPSISPPDVTRANSLLLFSLFLSSSDGFLGIFQLWSYDFSTTKKLEIVERRNFVKKRKRIFFKVLKVTHRELSASGQSIL